MCRDEPRAQTAGDDLQPLQGDLLLWVRHPPLRALAAHGSALHVLSKCFVKLWGMNVVKWKIVDRFGDVEVARFRFKVLVPQLRPSGSNGCHLTKRAKWPRKGYQVERRAAAQFAVG